MEKRPTKLTKEMMMQAAREVAARLAKSGAMSGEDKESLAEDIVSVAYPYIDGYELARKLEDWCGWHCDMQVAEVLDEFQFRAEQQHERAEKEWAERNNVQPPLPVGSRVKARWGRDEFTGTITEICRNTAAKYVVLRDDGAGIGHPVVNFEDVEALP